MSEFYRKLGHLAMFLHLLTNISIFQVVHSLLQSAVNSSCTVNNGGCDTLCLLSPGAGYNRYKCACPDHFHLSTNGKNCLSNCSTGQFKCKNYKCISRSWRCDLEDDCGDNSDEEGCPKRKCPNGNVHYCFHLLNQ